MGKIKITDVDYEIFLHKGLFGDGCYGAECDDECCQWGCVVDLESYNLIVKHRDLIEPLIEDTIEECFDTEMRRDRDYLGGSVIESKSRERDGRCAFHLSEGKGCSLYYLWRTKGISKRIIPTICKIWPVSWYRGYLILTTPIRRACKCNEKAPEGLEVPNLYETQRMEIHSLFDIDPSLIEKAKKRAERERLKMSRKRSRAQKAAFKRRSQGG